MNITMFKYYRHNRFESALPHIVEAAASAEVGINYTEYLTSTYIFGVLGVSVV